MRLELMQENINQLQRSRWEFFSSSFFFFYHLMFTLETSAVITELAPNPYTALFRVSHSPELKD